MSKVALWAISWPCNCDKVLFCADINSMIFFNNIDLEKGAVVDVDVVVVVVLLLTVADEVAVVVLVTLVVVVVVGLKVVVGILETPCKNDGNGIFSS